MRLTENEMMGLKTHLKQMGCWEMGMDTGMRRRLLSFTDLNRRLVLQPKQAQHLRAPPLPLRSTIITYPILFFLFFG